jgi:hypothetical protein
MLLHTGPGINVQRVGLFHQANQFPSEISAYSRNAGWMDRRITSRGLLQLPKRMLVRACNACIFRFGSNTSDSTPSMLIWSIGQRVACGILLCSKDKEEIFFAHTVTGPRTHVPGAD